MSYAAAESVAASSTWAATSLFYMLLVPALILWYAYWRMSRRHMYELAEKIEGPPGLPLIGNALEFTGGSDGKQTNLHILISSKIVFPYDLDYKSYDNKKQCFVGYIQI